MWQILEHLQVDQLCDPSTSNQSDTNFIAHSYSHIIRVRWMTLSPPAPLHPLLCLSWHKCQISTFVRQVQCGV